MCLVSTRATPCVVRHCSSQHIPRYGTRQGRGMVHIHAMRMNGGDDPSAEELLEECDEIEAEINVADFDNVSVELTQETKDEYVV
jgi:hypothetical protein